MTNKKKFLKLVAESDDSTLEQIKYRIKNRAMLRESQKIALKVLMKLDELGWSQKKLAEKMEVSPQQINKIVSGKENLTLETQIKLQNILDIPILATYYENLTNEISQVFQVSETEKYSSPTHQSGLLEEILLPKKEFKMEYDSNTKEYEYYQKLA